MPQPDSTPEKYVSRGGEKLASALDHFGLDVREWVCADLGSHVGGFVDCLVRRGAKRVYSVDTAYGLLAWRLRKDSRVVVLERTNAMHLTLPEPVDLVTIDTGWTRQCKILPVAVRLLTSQGADHGRVVSLIKPHYESDRCELLRGVLPEERFENVVKIVVDEIKASGWSVEAMVESPIRGHGGNREMFVLLAWNAHPSIDSDLIKP